MKIVDVGYLLGLFNRGEGSAVELYVEFVRKYSDDGISREAQFKDEGTVSVNMKSILYRNCTVEKVEKFLKEKINATKAVLLTRNSRKTVEQRAIFALFLRCFCNFSNRAICETMGSISQSRVSMLCAMGTELLGERAEYKDIMDEFEDLCLI